MPRVPLYQPNQVGPVQTTDARFRAADNNGGAAGGLAEGLQVAGRSTQQAAQEQFQTDRIYAEAAAKDAYNHVSQTIVDKGYGPGGYFTLQGKDALLGQPAFQDAVKSAVDQARGALKNPLAAKAFDDAWAPQQIELSRMVNTHADKETRTYAYNQSEGRGVLAAQGAVSSFQTSPDESENQIATAASETAARGRLLGLPDEKIAAQQLKTKSDIRLDITKLQAATHPDLALTYVQQHIDDFTPDGLGIAQAHITAGFRTQQVEARRQDALAKAQFHENVATVEAAQANGKDVSDQLPALIKAAEGYGDTSTAERLRGQVANQTYAVTYNSVPPLARQQRMTELAGIEKPTPDQQQELHWLREHGPAFDSQFKSDPVGFVIAHGRPGEQPPPLAANNPASFAARARWQRTMAAADGQMDLLSGNEKAVYTQRLGNGFQGYDSVANELALFGGAQSREAARQVAPNDHYLQQLVMLPDAYRKAAINGREARKENPKLAGFQDETGGADDDLKSQIAAYDLGVDKALRAVPQEDRNGIREVARNIAAKYLSDTGGTKLSPRLWDQAINMALGATGTGANRRGGLGKWSDQTFLVPDGFTEQQFADRVFGYVRSHPGNGPVNRDGSPASLRNARPVAVRKNVYQFFVGDNVVTAKTGGPWQFTLVGPP